MARRIKVKVARLAMALVTAVFLSGMAFNAAPQIDMQPNGYIKIRSLTGPHGDTEHYGNMFIMSTSTHPGAGWLIADYIFVDKNMWVDGNARVHDSAIISGHTIIGGSLTVEGNFSAPEPKGFIHPHPTDPTKLIRYVAIESGDVLTIARGTAKTINGQATITLPEHFSMVTSKIKPVTVILTPIGVPALLYTKQASRDEIVVAVEGKHSEVEFAYQVTGIRDGFEDVDVIVDENKLGEPVTKEENEVRKRINAYIERAKAQRATEHPKKLLKQEEYQELPPGATTTPAPIINESMAGISNEEMKNAQTPAPAPQSSQNMEAAVTAQAKTLIAEFTAGPNPADRRAGGVVNFYYQGKSIKNGQATIYDAAGNIIGKVKIRDSAQTQGDQSKRQVGWWNLTDRMGRLVSEGTYLVKGTVTGADGKKSVVSVMVGVR